MCDYCDSAFGTLGKSKAAIETRWNCEDCGEVPFKKEADPVQPVQPVQPAHTVEVVTKTVETVVRRGTNWSHALFFVSVAAVAITYFVCELLKK
jgi:hypothetical protein